MSHFFAVFVGTLAGLTIGALLLCYIIYKIGPKSKNLSISVQAALVAVFTYFNGIDHRTFEIIAGWIGWALALVIMYFQIMPKQENSSDISE